MKEARATAAQVVGKIGALDLARRDWAELIPQLQQNLSLPGAGVKQATLQALGYVCEDLDPSALEQAQVNVVLTAVVAGMRPEEEPTTRAVAANALDNALEFARANFEKQAERDYLMSQLSLGVQAPEASVRAACMEVLADIASLYYAFLPTYMQAVFELTSSALALADSKRGDEEVEEVAMRALDFWANVCEHEGECEAAEEEHGRYATAVAQPLVPLLLRALPSRLEHEEELDEETWDLSRAAGLCLQVLARAVGDPVLASVMPFVQANVGSPDWRAREAAVVAFASLLDGPTQNSVMPLAQGALPGLLNLLKDASLPVRRAAAYCLGIMFETLHYPSEPDQPQLVPAGADGLGAVLLALTGTLAGDDVSVADSAIWALDKLVQGDGDLAEQIGADCAAGTPLSPFFQALVEALLRASERPDATKLRLDAFDALCDTLTAATAPEGVLLTQLVPHLLGKLAATWEGAPAQLAAMSAEALEGQAELQGLLCGVLMMITSRLVKMGGQHKAALTGEGKPGGGLADSMMMAYLRVFACRSATVHGEALLAVSSLVDALSEGEAEKDKCLGYMSALQPVLSLGLKNYAESQVFANTVTLVGDLARALGKRIDPFANASMELLLQSLGSSELAKETKPHIIACFGDLALALEELFLRFLPHVSTMLAGAAQHSCSVVAGCGGDPDVVGANNELRASILEAYSGIFQGLKTSEEGLRQLRTQAQGVIEFLVALYADGSSDEGVLKAAVGVLGDLACMEGVAQALIMPRRELSTLLQQCLAADTDTALYEAASFAQREIEARCAR